METITLYEEWLRERRVTYYPSIGYESGSCRAQAIQQFSYAIPNSKAISVLNKLGPILEIGAGTGYWSFELRNAGGNIISTDLGDYAKYVRSAFLQVSGPRPIITVPYRIWGHVLLLDAETAVGSYGYDRSLLMCWPSYEDEWSANALRKYRGKHVAIVGEPWPGCTGSEALDEQLENEFRLETIVEIPRWAGCHDDLRIYARRD